MLIIVCAKPNALAQILLILDVRRLGLGTAAIFLVTIDHMTEESHLNSDKASHAALDPMRVSERRAHIIYGIKFYSTGRFSLAQFLHRPSIQHY